MIILNGKYNFAKVMLPNDKENILVHEAVDDADENEYKEVYTHLGLATQSQIESFLNHPAFRGSKIRIMPDTHYGKGSCVGFTMELGNYIIPNIIGVDIGCGILATRLPLLYSPEINLAEIDKFIRDMIPSGFDIHLGKTGEGLNSAFRDEIQETCEEVEADFNRAMNSLGTLGGGNHFIELGKDGENFLWLTIHSGSRNFGLKVATYFQERADKLCGDYFQDFGDLNFLPESSEEYHTYIDAMGVAQKFAHCNRLEMMSKIVYGYFNVQPDEIIDSVHNYIDFQDKIIRKGATAAHTEQSLVIPFNMEEGLIIGTGKENPDWNFSAPHGAGRILSRNLAKKSLSLQDAENSMKEAGVFTTSLSQETLDEAKGAYKNKDLILEMIQDTVEVNHWVKPIYNFKAK